MKTLFYLASLLAVALFLLPGCTPAGTGDKPVVQDAGGQDHDEHSHAHGPKGGEMFAFADAGIKGEWVAKYSDNLVTFYIYDADGKTEKKIKADKLVASRKVKDIETFDIAAVDAVDGMASKFEIVDETLAIAMKTTGAELEFMLDGVKHSTHLDKDPHAN